MASLKEPAGEQADNLNDAGWMDGSNSVAKSINRAPADDIAPWVARLYTSQVDIPPGKLMSCGLLADTPILRMIFGGDWTVGTRDGHGRYGPSALLFGAQTKRMPVQVEGSFSTLGVALRPGAMAVLGGPSASDTLDRIILYDHIFGNREWGSSAQMLEWFDPDGPPERWLKVAEYLFRDLVMMTGAKEPDPIIEAFDKAAFANPNFVIGEFAAEHGIERRRLERLIKKAYGQTAKQVLRRARVLDIAAHLLGVGDNTEEEEAALRFFDQSHMIREFQAFFGMTPRQFARQQHPFMILTIEARQSRRLEVLGLNEPGNPPPWRR